MNYGTMGLNEDGKRRAHREAKLKARAHGDTCSKQLDARHATVNETAKKKGRQQVSACKPPCHHAAIVMACNGTDQKLTRLGHDKGTTIVVALANCNLPNDQNTDNCAATVPFTETRRLCIRE